MDRAGVSKDEANNKARTNTGFDLDRLTPWICDLAATSGRNHDAVDMILGCDYSPFAFRLVTVDYSAELGIRVAYPDPGVLRISACEGDKARRC